MMWLDRLFDRPRRHVYGWWSFDDAESALVRDDGTRVRFLGLAADDNALDLRNSGNRRWMRFDLRSDVDRERPGVTARGLYVAGAFDSSGERTTWFEEPRSGP